MPHWQSLEGEGLVKVARKNERGKEGAGGERGQGGFVLTRGAGGGRSEYLGFPHHGFISLSKIKGLM